MGRLVRKELGGIQLLGFSLAGEESVIAAPEYNVCFDIGRAPREVISIDNVCLTHGHMDHAAGIAYYFSQRTFVGNAPGRVIVPQCLVAPLQSLMAVWAQIEGHPSPGTICGVRPLQDVTIRRNLLVRPFAVNHGGDALGFTLIEVRFKLKPEYFGKSGQHLAALKKEGVEIVRRVEVPLLTYTGDTALGRWLEHDFVQKSRGVLLECTFVDAEHRQRARAGRHMHIDDLPAALEALPEPEIMLIHLTRRTDLRQAKHMLRERLAVDQLDRISFLMDRPSRGNAQRTPHPRTPDNVGSTAKAGQ
jgi:ribonuclease Z